MKKIFGVDPESKVTAVMVRDAIVECFFKAHCQAASMGTGNMNDGEEMNKDYCRSVVRKSFDESGGDFENPTKDSLVRAIQRLAEFSKSFRDQEMIEKNYNKIKTLIDKID